MGCRCHESGQFHQVDNKVVSSSVLVGHSFCDEGSLNHESVYMSFDMEYGACDNSRRKKQRLRGRGGGSIPSHRVRRIVPPRDHLPAVVSHTVVISRRAGTVPNNGPTGSLCRHSAAKMICEASSCRAQYRDARLGAASKASSNATTNPTRFERSTLDSVRRRGCYE